MHWGRVAHLIRKEFLQIRRDPKMMRVVLVAPVVQLFVFGYAITAEVRHVRVAVLDEDRTRESRELVGRIEAARERFVIAERPASPAEIDRLLQSGRVHVALWIPRRFAADLGAGRGATVQALLDAADSKTASTIDSYLKRIVAAYSEEARVRLGRTAGAAIASAPRIDARLRAWYNTDLRNENYLVPGVLCLILLVIATQLTSLAIVREREMGTLEQLQVTPLTSSELMLGKMAPFVIIGYIDAALVVAGTTLWFRVPVAGSLLLLFALTATFLLASLGLGLLVSTVSRTQQQAMMTSVFIMQPSVLLSGFMFPIENIPQPIQWITYAIPLRYYLDIVRGVFLRGVGIDVLWPQTLALTALGGALLALSVVRFQKKVA